MTAMAEREGEQELETPGLEKEGVQQALTETLKRMQKQLTMPTDISVSNLPHPPVSVTDNPVPVRELPNSQIHNLDIQVDETVESVAHSVQPVDTTPTV